MRREKFIRAEEFGAIPSRVMTSGSRRLVASSLLSVAMFAFAACSGDNTITMNESPDLGGGTLDAGSTDTGSEPADSGVGPADTGVGAADTGSEADSGSSGGQPFGGTCGGDGDCQMGFICRSFMQLGNVCTKACSVNTDCPVGSQGQRCNQMGVCRP